MAFSTEVLADTPRCYWQMRDASQSSQTDSSGNNHTLTLVNNPLTQQTSLTQEVGDFAVEFDRAAFEYAELNTPAALQGTGSKTLEWVGTIDTTPPVADMLMWVTVSASSGFTNGNLFSGIGIFFDGAVKGYASQGTNGANPTVTAAVDIADGLPHHVVLAVDSVASEIELYVDGVSYGTASLASGLWPIQSDSLIRVAGHNFVYNADGRVCEAALYDSRLVTARVQAHAAEVPGVFTPDNAVRLPVVSQGFITHPAVRLPVRSATMFESPAVRLPVVSEGPDPAHYTAAVARWAAIVKLDAVDVSARITGQIEIEHEENTSGLATLLLYPAPGAIDVGDYERKRVEITFEGQDAAGASLYQVRRFTGISTRAEYNPDAGVITVSCTTDLQGRLENLDRETITKVIGGLWSEHVFDDQADGWQYAQDRLSTQQAEVHVNNYGQIVVVPWSVGAVHTTFTDAGRFADTLTLERVSRRELVTRVRVSMDFRFVRLRHREIGVHFVDSLGICGYLNGAGLLCSRSNVVTAADSNAWTRVSDIIFGPLPPAGNICTPPRGWLGDNNEAFCLTATWTAARRWAQDITEEYTIDVIASDLEAAIGPQLMPFEFGVAAVYDADDFERVQEFDGPPTGAGFSTDSNDWQVDATDAERTGRLAMDAAQSCVLAWARAEILGRARRNRVTFDPQYDPSIDLSRTVRVNTPSLKATGKVRRLREVLDTASGWPAMTLSLAISRHGGSGTATSDTLAPAPVPAQPVETNTGRNYYVSHHAGGVIGAPQDTDALDGWITNAYGAARTDPTNLYRQRFRLNMPVIEQTARQAVAVQQAVEFDSIVPQDELTLVQ